jgi:2-polyprenyl-3-methyl-5-hydroxy-6-metoxy-1,4-benzoquinol methylase
MYQHLSRYYDLFTDDSLYDLYEEWITKTHPTGTLLDLGCGTGPLALRFAQIGYGVTGVDQSHEMLEEAYNKAVNNGLHIPFYVHDILDPIAYSYDIFTMASDVINYVVDQASIQTVFDHISNAMQQDSIFVFDFLRVSFLKELAHHKETIDLGEEQLMWMVESTDTPNQIKHTLTFSNEKETHIQQTYPLKVYKHLLNRSDLYIVKKKKTKERIILLCKKL